MLYHLWLLYFMKTLFLFAPLCEQRNRKLYPSKPLRFLLIEKLDEQSKNQTQRIARRKFYLKNGFTSSGIFIHGASGEMEVLHYLLIEKLDEQSKNQTQRIARRKFYLKNGFTSSGIFIHGASGEMEVLHYGSLITSEEYLSLQKHALGKLFFRLSGIKIINSQKSR